MSDDPDVFEGLPSTPLTTDVIRALQQHPDLKECLPLYERTRDSKIVAVLVQAEDSSAVAVFNPVEQYWEAVYRTETFENVYGADASTSRKAFADQLERVHDFYAEDTVRLLDPRETDLFNPQDNPFTGLLAGLPDEPLTKETLAAFKQETDVVEVIPQLYLVETETVVMFTVTFDDVVAGERKFGVAFYQVDAGHWVPSFSMAASRLDDESDTEFEDAVDRAFGAVIDGYDTSELATVNTREEYETWIPGTPVATERNEDFDTHQT